ncbi:type I restriction-modification enzyme R subunit C-terminal domain-containing protein, partial [Sharpea azabuensis]|uniref:type I restriction-modification enzyme R subunit C-terminal domain-containing protein n=1 Tax=Sharpea azabuensis TaxID=322505 RepID=UPI00240A026A
MKNYKAKAEYYIRQHQDNVAIAKLKTNQPLTSTDVASLEKILWKEVGTKQDYEHEFGTKPLGEFVREIVGLDMNGFKETVRHYKSQGYTIAIDDAGSCYSGLNLICDIVPHYLKLDMS